MEEEDEPLIYKGAFGTAPATQGLKPNLQRRKNYLFQNQHIISITSKLEQDTAAVGAITDANHTCSDFFAFFQIFMFLMQTKEYVFVLRNFLFNINSKTQTT